MATATRTKTKGWKLVNEARNRHYIGKKPGIDYEATMQHCWAVEGPGGEFVADIITAPIDAGGRKVAWVMAAGPRMLKALEALVRCPTTEALREARAAIQSARGTA
jgi:hypothetical protein